MPFFAVLLLYCGPRLLSYVNKPKNGVSQTGDENPKPEEEREEKGRGGGGEGGKRRERGRRDGKRAWGGRFELKKMITASSGRNVPLHRCGGPPWKR